MSAVTLNGVAVMSGRVNIPAWGVWYADVELSELVEVEGPAVLIWGDAVCACTKLVGGTGDGRAVYRLAGGSGGWGRPLPAQGYVDDAGVKVDTIARDAATAVGEVLGAPSVERLGPHFARVDGAAASSVMNSAAPQAWHVGLDGITAFGLRSSLPYIGDGTRTRVNAARGVIDVATELGFSALVPGVTVDGAAPAVDVEWRLDESGAMVARVYTGPTPGSRRVAALAKILEAVDPSAKYRGVFGYRVVTQVGERLNLQPERAGSRMPDLTNVPVRPGIAGARATVTLGELVCVAFVDADPSRPVVFAHDSAEAPAFAPSRLDLGGASGTDSPITKAYWAIEQAKIVSAISTAGGAYSPGTAPDKITRIK